MIPKTTPIELVYSFLIKLSTDVNVISATIRQAQAQGVQPSQWLLGRLSVAEEHLKHYEMLLEQMEEEKSPIYPDVF